MSMTFNNRLQVDHFELTKSGQQQPVISNYYTYYADNGLRKLDDVIDNKFDRLNTYDNLGRPKTAKTSFDARGETPTQQQITYEIPYLQSYQFDAFDHLTQRNNRHWSNNFDFSFTYENNRITSTGFQYDADGREIVGWSNNSQIHSTYNNAGQLIVYHRAQGPSEHETERFYNGDGREEKRKSKNYVEVEPDEWEWQIDPPTYYIRSSVLGGEVVSDVGSSGYKARTYVRAEGATIAWQNGSQQSGTVVFQHTDVWGMSYRTSGSNGNINNYEGAEGGPAELDLFGGNAGRENPYIIVSSGEPCFGCQILTPEMPFYVNGQPLKANR